MDEDVNEPITNDNFDEDIDPDTSSPSEPFVDRFKDILNDFTDDKWALFEATVNEFVEDIQKTYKIKVNNNNNNRPPPPQNPHDPTFIQRLYRRNRRSAIRKVLEKPFAQCNIAHEILKAKLFTPITTTPDTSNYNDYKKAENPPSHAPSP